MPIVDIEEPGLGSVIDTPRRGAVTPGKDELDHGSDAPGFLRGAAAIFRHENPLTSFLVSEDRGSSPAQEPGFNPWDSIKGSTY